jgi:hypothetical protein
MQHNMLSIPIKPKTPTVHAQKIKQMTETYMI